MVFETRRMRVRRIVPTDLDAMMAVYADLALMRYVGDGTAMSLVECREGGGHVGFVGLTHPGGQEEPEIKYVIRPEFGGQGMAQELVAGTCAFCFERMGLTTIIATVHPDNAASNHILAKCGFARRPDRVEEDGAVTWVWELRAS
jgi:RimJ/RimL family protein N-acetyltransferase